MQVPPALSQQAHLQGPRQKAASALANSASRILGRDKNVLEVRHHHKHLDRAVLEAYGWSYFEMPPYETPETDEAEGRLESFEDEIIDRLFVLNAQRAEEERRLGLAVGVGEVGKDAKKAPAGKRKGSTGHEGQGGFFRVEP